MIDFEAKTDRELLVLVAQKSNETSTHLARLNDRILKHERRITSLESSGGCGASESKGLKSTLISKWPTFSLLATVIALIVIEVSQRV